MIFLFQRWDIDFERNSYVFDGQSEGNDTQVIALGAAVDGAFASIASTPVVGYITQHFFHYQRHRAQKMALIVMQRFFDMPFLCGT